MYVLCNSVNMVNWGYLVNIFLILSLHVFLQSVDILVRETGSSLGKGDILFLHGQSFSSEDWENTNTLALFTALGYNPVAVDLPDGQNYFAWLRKKPPLYFVTVTLYYMSCTVLCLSFIHMYIHDPLHSGAYRKILDLFNLFHYVKIKKTHCTCNKLHKHIFYQCLS